MLNTYKYKAFAFAVLAGIAGVGCGGGGVEGNQPQPLREEICLRARDLFRVLEGVDRVDPTELYLSCVNGDSTGMSQLSEERFWEIAGRLGIEAK